MLVTVIDHEAAVRGALNCLRQAIEADFWPRVKLLHVIYKARKVKKSAREERRLLYESCREKRIILKWNLKRIRRRG